MDVDVTNQVTFGDNLSMKSSGLLQVGAYSDTRASTNARVDVYGLVGAGGGDSKIDLTAAQLIRFGANADLLGYGNPACAPARAPTATWPTTSAPPPARWWSTTR